MQLLDIDCFQKCTVTTTSYNKTWEVLFYVLHDAVGFNELDLLTLFGECVLCIAAVCGFVNY